MALFTGLYANPLDPLANPTMQAALNATRQTLSLAGTPNVDTLALIVVALTGYEGTTNHPWAGLREKEEHYSGSLVKVAAMYAAFDLRASADQLATDAGLTTWPQIEAALKSSFNPEIDAHTPPLISGSPLLRPQDKTRKPNYSAVLQLGMGPDFVVDFTQSQLAAFEDMMVQQNNPGATTTIHGLGYPYLNGKIADDGFFDGVGQGLWLAGDYAAQWPAARIPCVNDFDTAQGTTAWHLAMLLTLLADDMLVGPLSSQGMKDLMARAGKFFPQTTPPIWPANGRFFPTHGKVGIGPLKSGKSTFSEGLILRDTARDLGFVAVWQNVVQKGQTPLQLFQPVATLIEAAIDAFVP
jgi:hypothetical protein